MVGRLVGWSVTLELKSGKTRISAPAHPSATDGRVSGLVLSLSLVSLSRSLSLYLSQLFFVSLAIAVKRLPGGEVSVVDGAGRGG